MRGLACAKCLKFLRAKKNGVWVEEGMPIRQSDNSDKWQSYKLWQADLYECPGCGLQIIAGFGAHPAREHYQDDYQKFLEHSQPYMGRIDDCGGCKP